ncbi:hypothetical protein SLA2020_033830 [Shorea laevis]
MFLTIEGGSNLIPGSLRLQSFFIFGGLKSMEGLILTCFLQKHVIRLVFKLADKTYGFRNSPLKAAVLLGGAEVSKREVYLQAARGIVGNGDQYPKERGDNWFEVELG